MPVRVGLRHIELWNSNLENAVLEYEKETVEQGQIVFYGPSYFTRWSAKFGETPMREVILGKSGRQCVINRGFGSSCSEHQLYYYPRMVRPLAPTVMVYECFGNAGAFGYSIEERWELAQRVIAYAMTDFPGIHVYVCGAHPTRDMTEEQVADKQRFNAMVRQFAEETSGCFFIDVLGYEPMQSKEIFVEDGVHLNPEGYRRYAQMFREALRDELEKF